ncbi:MAG: carbohydrate kinase family protein [Chitinophagaceae bacterium]|nr:carbohydrate kinase family protein [Chitinophagaceae bacterium]
MKKYDVVVIGELNADLILNQVDGFPVIGKEILARQINLTMGSSSAILAYNLATLGSKVAFIGKLGKDVLGQFLIGQLGSKGIHTTGVRQQESYTTGATVVLNYGEDRAMVTCPGAMEHLTIKDIDWEIVARSKHLHLSSFFLQTSLKKNIGKIFSKAKQLGLTTSLDPQWDPAEKWELEIENILPHTDIFLPNEKELLNITKCTSVKEAVGKLQKHSRIIVIKQGNEGSTLIHHAEWIKQPAYFNPEVVDAIGAGDSFNAGFIYQYTQNNPLPDCQQFGNMVAAYSTTAPGGTGAFTDRKKIFSVLKEKYGYKEN